MFRMCNSFGMLWKAVGRLSMIWTVGVVGAGAQTPQPTPKYFEGECSYTLRHGEVSCTLASGWQNTSAEQQPTDSEDRVVRNGYRVVELKCGVQADACGIQVHCFCSPSPSLH